CVEVSLRRRRRLLEGVAVGVACGLAAAAGRRAVEEIRKRVETQLAAEIAIEDLRDRSAAQFIAEFGIVATEFPGKIVNEVPVGIHALAGIPSVGADRSETAN